MRWNQCLETVLKRSKDCTGKIYEGIMVNLLDLKTFVDPRVNSNFLNYSG